MDLKKIFYSFPTLLILICFTTAFPARKTWRECEDMKTKDEECCILHDKTVEIYNLNTHICCNGTRKRHEKGLKCCFHPATDTSETYYDHQSVCCGGQLHLKGNVNQGCCNGEFYNKEKELCCPDNRNMRLTYIKYEIEIVGLLCPFRRYEDEHCKENINHGCCGNKPYSLVTEVCCNGRSERKTKEIHTCCGTKFIGIDDKCCGDKVLKTNESCCGGKPYNSTTSKCISNDRIVPIVSEICANQVYNPADEVCCGTHPMTKRKNDDNACCKARGHKPGTTINTKYEKCVYGKVYSTIKCNGTLHSPENFTCCSGTVYEQPAKNSVCCSGRAEWIRRNMQEENCIPSLCNGKFYNDHRYECCNNTLINPTKLRCINQKPYKYYKRHDSRYSNLKICGIYAVSNSYNCCAGTMPYKSNKYNCPLADFGYQKPIKHRNYPFWEIIKCNSKKMTGKITEINEYPRGLSLVFKVNSLNKDFIINISDVQSNKIKALKGKHVNVYYEKMMNNEIFFGEYSAIEQRGRRRNSNSVDPKVCEKLKHFLRSGSN